MNGSRAKQALSVPSASASVKFAIGGSSLRPKFLKISPKMTALANPFGFLELCFQISLSIFRTRRDAPYHAPT